MIQVAVIDYNVGNLTSILNMLKRLSVDAVITSDQEMIRSAPRIVLPGVGHFDACMESFHASGLQQSIEDCNRRGVPTLGICVGAQMMTRASEEGTKPGLGWVSATTVKFQHADQGLRVPHMGWADLEVVKPSALWRDLPSDSRFYFAHSFHFQFDDASAVIGRSEYGYPFACAFQKGNLYGVQFHPEKSHRFGMKLLENFASLPCL